MLQNNMWNKDYKDTRNYLNFDIVIFLNNIIPIWQLQYLKRRPTYDEIANLFGENQALTGGLPDRTATHFKASQEGSFFDDFKW